MQVAKKLKHRLNVWGVRKNIFLRGVKHEKKKDMKKLLGVLLVWLN